MELDGSDLTRWNVSRSLAGDILAAVADKDQRNEKETNAGTNSYNYTSLLHDYPNRSFPSEEALRTGVGVVLCAVDAPHLDFSMSAESDPTTRTQSAALATVDDRPIHSDDTDSGEQTPVWSRAVNLLAQWLMSDRSQIRVGGKVRHRLNSWNEARHLAGRFVAVDEGDITYAEATKEWPDVEFPPENSSLTVIREAKSATDDKQHCIDEVARWIKSLDWLDRDNRDNNRVAMGGAGGCVTETPSVVIQQTDQLTLTGDVKPNEPQKLGQVTERSIGDFTSDGDRGAVDENVKDDTGADNEQAQLKNDSVPSNIGTTARGDLESESVGEDDGNADSETSGGKENALSHEARVVDSSGENQTLTGCIETARPDREQ